MLEDDEDGPRGGHVALLVNAWPERALPFARLLQARQAEMLICHADPKVAAALTVELLDEGAEAASQRLDPATLEDWTAALQRAMKAFGSANVCVVLDTPAGLAGERHAALLAGFRLFLGGAWRSSRRHALILVGRAGEPKAALDHLIDDLTVSALPSSVSLHAFGAEDPEAERVLRRFLDSR